MVTKIVTEYISSETLCELNKALKNILSLLQLISVGHLVHLNSVHYWDLICFQYKPEEVLGQCGCYHGYHGSDCSLSCVGGSDYPCNGNGICDTGNGTCTCYDSANMSSDCSVCNSGWYGTDCSVADLGVQGV